jgi:hypothetical protein
MHLLHLAILLVVALVIVALLAVLLVGLVLMRYVGHANRSVSPPQRPARPAERRVAFTWDTSFDPNADPATQQFAAIHGLAQPGPPAAGTNRNSTIRKEGHDRQRRA